MRPASVARLPGAACEPEVRQTHRSVCTSDSLVLAIGLAATTSSQTGRLVVDALVIEILVGAVTQLPLRVRSCGTVSAAMALRRARTGYAGSAGPSGSHGVACAASGARGLCSNAASYLIGRLHTEHNANRPGS